MPNHLHMIVEIKQPAQGGHAAETHGHASLRNPPNHDAVQTHGRASPPDLPGDDDFQSELSEIKRNRPERLPHSISSFMGGFKSAVNTQICNYSDEHQLKIRKYNRNNHFFQKNYHDHIIRNDREYRNIIRYIINNPGNWNKDSWRHRGAAYPLFSFFDKPSIYGTAIGGNF